MTIDEMLKWLLDRCEQEQKIAFDINELRRQNLANIMQLQERDTAIAKSNAFLEAAQKIHKG